MPDVAGVRLKLGVTEAAEDGRANRAVCALIAASLGVAQNQVSVVLGATSRQKQLLILGEAAPITERLAAICRDLTGDNP